MQEFDGNKDQNTVVTHVLSSPIHARFVRVHPKAWYRWISMRLEFIGCLTGTLSLPKYCSNNTNNKNITTVLVEQRSLLYKTLVA